MDRRGKVTKIGKNGNLEKYFSSIDHLLNPIQISMFIKKLSSRLLAPLLLIMITLHSAAQDHPPFWDEIQEFKTQDSIQPSSPNAILMIGSSSFRLWKDVASYFPGYTFINRGFGGSSLPDVERYYDDIILPYKTRQILIYCGENDLGPTVNGDSVVTRFKTLFKRIRLDHKKARISFISIKPSGSRAHLMPQMEIANKGIKQFLGSQKNTDFIDVYHKMLTPEEKPLPGIYRNDKLHMNEKGYAIWQKEISPILVRKKK